MRYHLFKAICCADLFANYFFSKVANICSSFPPIGDLQVPHAPSKIVNFSEFKLLSSSEVSKLRHLKSSAIDILPPDLFKAVFPLVLPVLTELINMSLSTGLFPDSFKTAHITPLLKSPCLDNDALSSYRPVSNLGFFSKVLETAVNVQLQSHFDNFDLLHTNQSAYRKHHSVETALLHVTSSILKEVDQGKVVFLVLLDLSAAFDTIQHDRILLILNQRFGISGTALSWIESYLSARRAVVKIGQSVSSEMDLNVGVPQGRVLRPVLFNCLMAGLSTVIESRGANCHIYADETQFWLSFNPLDPAVELVARSMIA
jgi:hypothetical protein